MEKYRHAGSVVVKLCISNVCLSVPRRCKENCAVSPPLSPHPFRPQSVCTTAAAAARSVAARRRWCGRLGRAPGRPGGRLSAADGTTRGRGWPGDAVRRRRRRRSVAVACGFGVRRAGSESVLSLIADTRRPLAAGARVRPPVLPRVDPSLFIRRHRVHSVWTRGLKVRIPSAVPPVWRATPRSDVVARAVDDFVRAGVLRPGRPLTCYRLFAVAKSETVARLVYDLSELTPHLPTRPCVLPSVGEALGLAAQGYRYAIKLDLCEGFYSTIFRWRARPKINLVFFMREKHMFILGCLWV